MIGEPVDLTDDLVAYYRQVLVTHAATPESNRVCGTCGIVRCPLWLDAYDKLAAARQPMCVPELWEPFVPGWKRPTN